MINKSINPFIKYIKLLLIFLLCSFFMFGCNDNETPAEDPATEEVPEDNTGDTPADNPENPAPAQANDAPAEEPVTPTPIAEKSPVAVSRIEPPTPTYPEKAVTGAGTDDSPVEEEKDQHDHEPVPNLFPVDMCQVEVNGVYDSTLAKALVDAINAARVDYMIPPVTRNTSLLACADIRCKEQSYFIGHFRPDGKPWQSVAQGYVQGECIAIDYREAADIVEAWLSVNETRVQLMNPDYTQIGTSVYNIGGTYFIAAEFGY